MTGSRCALSLSFAHRGRQELSACSNFTQRISCNCHQSVIHHPPSIVHHRPSTIDSPSRDATLPPLHRLQASPRCHWLHQPSLAHAAHAGPVALASFGKAARGSVAGPELRRRELHAIGPMAVPADRGFQARRAASSASHQPHGDGCDGIPCISVFDLPACTTYYLLVQTGACGCLWAPSLWESQTPGR